MKSFGCGVKLVEGMKLHMCVVCTLNIKSNSKIFVTGFCKLIIPFY